MRQDDGEGRASSTSKLVAESADVISLEDDNKQRQQRTTDKLDDVLSQLRKVIAPVESARAS